MSQQKHDIVSQVCQPFNKNKYTQVRYNLLGLKCLTLYILSIIISLQIQRSLNVLDSERGSNHNFISVGKF